MTAVEKCVFLTLRLRMEMQDSQNLSTEMQENTWARLRESSTHQGASHAT